MGRRRRRVRRGRPHRPHRRAALRPLQLDAARVRRGPRRVQPRHGPVDDPLQQPVPGLRGDHDGPGARRRHRQAAASSRRTSAAASATRSRRTRSSSPAACSRASSAARSSGPSGAPTSTSRCRTATSAGSRTRGRGQGRRHAARLPLQGARRRRRVPALRAARRRDLGAGDAGHVPVAPHPRRLQAGRHEQGAGLAEPRLLAHAAPLDDRAGHRHRRARARLRSGRDPQAELHPARADALRDAERRHLRLGRLPARAGHGARDDRLRHPRGAPRRGQGPRQAVRHRHRLHARLRDEQLRPVALRQPRPAVLGQQRGRDRQARHLRRARRHARARRRRGRATRRRPRRSSPSCSAARPTS